MVFFNGWADFKTGLLRFWFVMLLLGTWCAQTFAQTPPSELHVIERQQDQIQQLQQQRLDQRDKERWWSEKPPASTTEIPGIPKDEAGKAVCFVLRSVVFEGASLLSEQDREDLAASYLGRCVTIADINALIRSVTDLYGARGFVTTRAFLPRQNIAEGVLTLRVTEGRIQEFNWNDGSEDRRSEMATAFPSEAGEILNLRDLEQGLDQLNRLRLNNARMRLIPGDRPGETRVVIDNEESKPWRITAGADNSGQKSTGELQVKESVGLEDIFGLNESLEVDHRQDLLNDSSLRCSRSWAVAASIPYGYWRLNTSFNSMYYRSLIYGQYRTYQTAGNQRALSMGVDRLLYRDGNGKTFASLALTYKSIHNSILGIETEISSPKLATVGLSLDDVRRLMGGVLHSDVQISGGLHMWGARDDSAWPDSPKAQFVKYQGDLSYGYPVDIGGMDFSLSVGAHGQWTTDSLYSTEQIAIGGESTVRGFKDQILQGNRGGYLRNEVSVALPTGVSTIDETLGVLHPFAAYDIGTVAHFHPESSLAGRLSGAALGVRLGGSWLEGELTYAWPLSYPAVIETPPHQLTFSLVLAL